MPSGLASKGQGPLQDVLPDRTLCPCRMSLVSLKHIKAFEMCPFLSLEIEVSSFQEGLFVGQGILLTEGWAKDRILLDFSIRGRSSDRFTLVVPSIYSTKQTGKVYSVEGACVPGWFLSGMRFSCTEDICQMPPRTE